MNVNAAAAAAVALRTKARRESVLQRLVEALGIGFMARLFLVFVSACTRRFRGYGHSVSPTQRRRQAGSNLGHLALVLVVAVVILIAIAAVVVIVIAIGLLEVEMPFR